VSFLLFFLSLSLFLLSEDEEEEDEEDDEEESDLIDFFPSCSEII